MSLPISYSVRNVRARLRRTSLTIAVIALAVVATAVFLALLSSLQRTLVSTGSPDNLVVLRKGSDNDGSSMLTLEAFQAIRFLDGIARDAEGTPLVSPEMVVQPSVWTTSGGRENVLVARRRADGARGARPGAHRGGPDVPAEQRRDRARPRHRRTLPRRQPRRRDAVRARAVARRRHHRCGGLVVRERDLGRRARARERREPPVPLLGRASAVRARRRSCGAHGAASTTTRATRSRPSSRPTTTPSRRRARASLYFLLVILAVPVGIGAGLGAANTMYAAVQARTAEIGTLRALGFSRATILRAFLVESFGVAMVGFVVGALGTLAWRRCSAWCSAASPSGPRRSPPTSSRYA